MKKLFLYTLLITSCYMVSCTSGENNNSEQKDSMASAPDTTISKADEAEDLDTLDAYFFKTAAIGGMVEVESSNKIMSLTKKADIKSFAEMMIKDHGAANMKLKQLASNKGYSLPAVLPESKLAVINKLTTLRDEGRNKYYTELMVSEHRNAIDLFSRASRSQDKDISAFAKQTLPTLEMHYQHIFKIDSLQKLPKVNQGDDNLKLSNRKK